MVDRLMKNPTRAFATPKEVCETITLTRDQKVRVLRRWKQNVAATEVTEDDLRTDAMVPVEEISAALKRLQEK